MAQRTNKRRRPGDGVLYEAPVPAKRAPEKLEKPVPVLNLLDFLDSTSFWEDVAVMENEGIMSTEAAEAAHRSLELSARAYDSDGETDTEEDM
mmetsp:Transcript_38539/g.120650  ORF Transcript_38539/g.120650 Transcript_38539/m.120650 type:complete len:93 (+) Transcript_38539:166-444(+)|eukprot:CAMPEP_0118888300 /NCGR_PEP_ID=MMETSP1163-20130328/25650_1 /TAXON_ID=124430 /ORGANISM="Phaeomonas parva, Strain CCMP2877" /LENGTH=92 /DNA_ID=CAMNT_0006826863 /DNA_START=814 /DNA_END=1092 /DNA_ORIENTATION=-